MTYPRDTAMALLASIHVGNGVCVQDGQLFLPDPTDANRLIHADDADLGELEARGWLVIDADGVRTTERGDWWLNRWIRATPAVRRCLENV